LRDHILGLADEHVKIHVAGGRGHLQAAAIPGADVECRWVEIIEEEAIAAAADVERNALVAFVVFAGEGITVDDLDLVAALVERCTLVAKPVDALLGREIEHGGATGEIELPVLDQDLLRRRYAEQDSVLGQDELERGGRRLQRRAIVARLESNLDNRI